MNPQGLKKPNVSEELAIDLTLRHYGLKVTSIKRMVSYDDQNFHVKVSAEIQNPHITSIAEEGYTLKVTNTKKSALEGHFDSMHGVLTHLDKKGLRVPVPVKNKNGTTWKLEKVPLLNERPEDADERCGIHLLTFIPGQPVSTVAYTKSLLYQWGYLLAKFHNAAEDLISPTITTKDIFWNLEHVLELKTFVKGLEADKKDLVLGVLNQYPDQIGRHQSNLKRGIIHGDFNENNILLRTCMESAGDEPQYIVEGILDLEDFHYGTYAWDVGVMLAYTMLDCKTMDPLEGAGHALAGYLSLRSLEELEMVSLQICIASRLCQSLVLGAYTHNLDPTNSYLIASARTGWNRLGQVWSTSMEELLTKWKEIQKEYNIQQN